MHRCNLLNSALKLPEGKFISVFANNQIKKKKCGRSVLFQTVNIFDVHAMMVWYDDKGPHGYVGVCLNARLSSPSLLRPLCTYNHISIWKVSMLTWLFDASSGSLLAREVYSHSDSVIEDSDQEPPQKSQPKQSSLDEVATHLIPCWC